MATITIDPLTGKATSSVSPIFIQNTGNQPARPLTYSTYEAPYTSYGGVDIVCQLVLPGEPGPLTFAELQTISYSIHRENTPVRFLGHVNPAGFLRGPRTIGGSMVFTTFNEYAFYRLRQFNEALSNGIYPLSDMLPPFDIVLTFANESGSFSKMKIYGCTIVDEGGAMSIDDVITEGTATFMARGIQPLTSVPVALETRSSTGPSLASTSLNFG